MSELYIGVQGWSYPDWVGSFYPPESKQEHWLPFYAEEFRSRSWHDERTWQLLRRRRACLVWSEWRDLPPVTEVTGDFLYLRWMGHREAITRFDRVRIDRGSEFDAWHAAIERALPQVG